MPTPLILIAEGDSILRQDLKGQLLKHGYNLVEARDRATTLQTVRTCKSDIVC
jgi:hypothetical protein